jgi:hypothetical protein
MTRIFSILAATALFVSGCDMPESRLAPIANALSFAQHEDFYAAGIGIPSDGSEFEVMPMQAAVILSRIQGRNSTVRLAANLRLTNYAVFFREVLDPVLRGARGSPTHPRPFTVIVYEIGETNTVDRKCDVFIMASVNERGLPNHFPQPSPPSRRG